MANCPQCGANLALVGRVHNCRPRKVIIEATTVASIKKGRPRIGESRERPWEKLGMSRRTWFRRQAEKKK